MKVLCFDVLVLPWIRSGAVWFVRKCRCILIFLLLRENWTQLSLMQPSGLIDLGNFHLLGKRWYKRLDPIFFVCFVLFSTDFSVFRLRIKFFFHVVAFYLQVLNAVQLLMFWYVYNYGQYPVRGEWWILQNLGIWRMKIPQQWK